MEPLRTLKQCLIDTHLPHLRIIARFWGLELKATRHREIAAELAEALADPVYAAEVWANLPDEQRAALETLLAAGGLMPAATFRRRFGEIRPIGPGRLERETPWREPVSVAEGLWYRGLIFGGFADEEKETYPAVFIPAALQAALPARVEPARSVLQLDPAPPPTHPDLAGDLLLDDLTTALSFIHNQRVRPRGGELAAWPQAARQRLSNHLRHRDPGRLDFILHLIEHLGWVRLDEEGRMRLLAEPVLSWLRAPVEESRATLIDAWRQMTGWDELWRLTSLRPDSTATLRHDPTLARNALLRHLEPLVPGQWVTVDEFVAAVKAAEPDFQRPGGDYETWYLRDTTTGAYLTGFESWDQVEGVLLRALLSGPAWWLGLVDLGSDAQADPPTAFRPRARPGPRSAIQPSPPDVRPDLTVAMPATRRFERFQLARVADLVGVDELYLFRLTPTSLNRARQQRIDLVKVLDFLDGLSGRPLPAPVRSSLTRWAERGTEAWLERALILRVADAALLEQIVGSPKTGHYLKEVVGPSVALVAEKDWPRLLAALAELGLMTELVDFQEGKVRGENL